MTREENNMFLAVHNISGCELEQFPKGLVKHDFGCVFKVFPEQIACESGWLRHEGSTLNLGKGRRAQRQKADRCWSGGVCFHCMGHKSFRFTSLWVLAPRTVLVLSSLPPHTCNICAAIIALPESSCLHTFMSLLLT